jgi:hypothetical protein
VPTKVDFRSRGSALQIAGTDILQVAPSTFILSGIGKISSDLVRLRLNGLQIAQVTADQ